MWVLHSKAEYGSHEPKYFEWITSAFISVSYPSDTHETMSYMVISITKTSDRCVYKYSIQWRGVPSTRLHLTYLKGYDAHASRSPRSHFVVDKFKTIECIYHALLHLTHLLKPIVRCLINNPMVCALIDSMNSRRTTKLSEVTFIWYEI